MKEENELMGARSEAEPGSPALTGPNAQAPAAGQMPAIPRADDGPVCGIPQPIPDILDVSTMPRAERWPAIQAHIARVAGTARPEVKRIPHSTVNPRMERMDLEQHEASLAYAYGDWLLVQKIDGDQEFMEVSAPKLVTFMDWTVWDQALVLRAMEYPRKLYWRMKYRVKMEYDGRTWVDESYVGEYYEHRIIEYPEWMHEGWLVTAHWKNRPSYAELLAAHRASPFYNERFDWEPFRVRDRSGTPQAVSAEEYSGEPGGVITATPK